VSLRKLQDHRNRRSAAGEIAFAITLFLLLLAGCRPSPPRLTPQQAEGRQLYQGRCAHCHEENDLGLKTIPPDLHRLFLSAAFPSGAPATDQQLRQVVLAGKGTMPSFAGRFTPDQFEALLAYLHTGIQK
jgi:mono/diheme cytochrome c family protein